MNRASPPASVHLTTSGALGGAERMMLELLSVHATGAYALVLCQPGPLETEAARAGIAVTMVPIPQQVDGLGDASAHSRGEALAKLARTAPAVAGWFGDLRRTLRGLSRPGVTLISQDVKSHLAGVLTAPRGWRLVWHLQDYFSGRPALEVLTPLATRMRRVRIVACSEHLAADTRRVLGAHTEVVTILSAIDLERFRPVADTRPLLAELDAAAGLPPAKPEVVAVGLVAMNVRWKGHEVFLRALGQLPESVRARVRSYVIGGAISGPPESQWTLDELRAIARQRCPAMEIAFTGYLTAPERAMAALDVVVHASTEREPFGLVIAEGMACGKAVITTGTGGSAELVEPERDALLVEAGSAEALCAAIVRLVEAPALRAKLGGAAAESARRRFDRRRLVGQWTEFLT